MSESTSLPSFSELGLSDAVVAALTEVGYETPTPIQAQTIPAILEGTDLLGQAQSRLGRLVAALKHHRRQARAVRAAVDSIRQLPPLVP